LPLLVVVGLVVVWRRSVAARSVLFGWALAGPLSIAVTGLLGRHFFPRFEVFLLPLVVLTVAIACVTLSERLFAQRPRAAGLAPWLLLAAFGAAVAPQLRLLLTHPYAPLRDVARRVSADPDTLRVGYGFGTGVEHVYDPEVRYAGSAKALRAACREAHASGRPFLAFYGYPQKNLRRGDGVALLEDPREFALTDEFVGIDPDFRYRVFEPVRAGCSPRE
jgi:hypothetical protein